MQVCHTWLGEDYLRRRGYRIETDGGQRYAVSDRCRWPIDPPCGHPPDQCPPFDQDETRPDLAT
jgi:hypothetical protein